MKSNLTLLLSLRYLRKRNKFFFSLWPTLNIMGILLGVFSILVTSSFMDGLKKTMLEQFLSNKPNISIVRKDNKNISNYQDIKRKTDDTRIERFYPIIELKVMLKKGLVTAGSELFGIDNHSNFLSFLENAPILLDNQIMIGYELANILQVEIGQEITCYSTNSYTESAFGRIPSTRVFSVAWIFSSSDPSINSKNAYITLNSAKTLGKIQKLQIKLSDPFSADLIKKDLEQILGEEYIISSWIEQDKNIYQSLKIEKIALNFVLFLIIILALFNMSGNFIRVVTERSTDIGILKALGLSNLHIERIFLVSGIIIGFLGVSLGMLLAFIFLKIQYSYQIFSIPTSGLSFDSIPVVLNYQNFIYIFLFVLLSSAFASIYPCKKTKKISPIEILKD